MAQRPRIYYTAEQKAEMWDRRCLNVDANQVSSTSRCRSSNKMLHQSVLFYPA